MVKLGNLVPFTAESSTTASSVLERAGDWFLRSGIQQPDGGVARYYRTDLRRNAGLSSEITGYSISFLVYLHKRTGQAQYLEAAARAARFLTRSVWLNELGLFPFEPAAHGSGSHALAYFFDSGIIVRGLLTAWRATQEPEFLDIAVRAGQGMLQHFQTEHGSAPILVLPSRQQLPYEPRWSASPGCYQLKSTLAWHDLFDITGDPAFRDAYQRAVAGALRSHDSFLPGDPLSERVMDRLHAYCYFLEGLLPCADRPECQTALRTGIDRVAVYLREIAPQFVRSDVYAQLLRIRLFASSLGIAPLHTIAACEEAAAAARFQFDSGSDRLLGGFGFGLLTGEMMPFVNPVSTAFCGQAIDLWRRSQAGPLHLEPHLLV